MSDNVELAELSIKDLRHLAGEHHIQNRSRLGRDDLILALTNVIASAAQTVIAAPTEVPSAATAPGQEAVVPAPAEPPPAASAEPPPAEAPTPASAPASATAVPAVAAPSPTSEPETLDAAAVASLVQAPPDQPGEGHRRRRRRRRGGRNRDRGDGQGREPGDVPSPGGAEDGDDDEVVDDEDGDDADSVDQGPAVPAPASAPHAVPATAASAPLPPRPAPPPHHGQPGQAPRSANGVQPNARPQDQRPPRPRLDGPQRNMPSVLDRLCTFTRGILELCDPSTPSWAQARLGELLAESGLVPIPCLGQPHPDFHQVVGTVVAKDIPAGHIAVVESPGFALRGDRGDLFPQRRAQVRVSGDKDERSAVQVPPQRLDPVRPAAPPQGVPTVRADPSPQPPRGESHPPHAASRAAEPAAAGEEPPAHAQTALPSAPRSPAPAPMPVPVPQAGRDPHKPHSREYPSESPALPLAQQDPAELAQRPKAEAFRSLGLNEQILADVAAIGWAEPLPIQIQAIPVAITGKDLIGQAQTGTGKTGAFALPILQKLYTLEDQERRPVALVLCPTRELAKQVYSEFTKMAGASGARATVIYGGTPMDEQFRAIERCPHIIIGTPGRIIDHMKRRSLDFSRLAMVVLDEADQMLDIGFWPDVQYIIGHTPPNRQILLFSATFPEPIRLMAEKHMKEPVHIRIIPKVVTVDQVDQKYIAVDRERKTSLLAHFIDTQKPESMLVFCRTKHQTDRVAEVLKRKHYSAGAIHGDLPQTKREKILAQFRGGELKSLIATNVAARGLDIPIVSHVVNYDIPEMPEEYVHRIGRTARNGAPGVARTFITPEDGQFLLEIEKHIGLLLEEEHVEGFTAEPVTAAARRTVAETPVGSARLIKPLTGGIRLGRRRR